MNTEGVRFFTMDHVKTRLSSPIALVAHCLPAWEAITKCGVKFELNNVNGGQNLFR